MKVFFEGFFKQAGIKTYHQGILRNINEALGKVRILDIMKRIEGSGDIDLRKMTGSERARSGLKAFLKTTPHLAAVGYGVKKLKDKNIKKNK